MSADFESQRHPHDSFGCIDTNMYIVPPTQLDPKFRNVSRRLLGLTGRFISPGQTRRRGDTFDWTGFKEAINGDGADSLVIESYKEITINHETRDSAVRMLASQVMRYLDNSLSLPVKVKDKGSLQNDIQTMLMNLQQSTRTGRLPGKSVRRYETNSAVDWRVVFVAQDRGDPDSFYSVVVVISLEALVFEKRGLWGASIATSNYSANIQAMGLIVHKSFEGTSQQSSSVLRGSTITQCGPDI